jgi:hypothetical protein
MYQLRVIDLHEDRISDCDPSVVSLSDLLTRVCHDKRGRTDLIINQSGER